MIEMLSKWPARGPLYARRSMRDIAEAVAARHGLDLQALREATRARRIAHPRLEALYEIHQAGWSHQQGVRFLGLKDHTASVYACATVKEWRALAQQEAA